MRKLVFNPIENRKPLFFEHVPVLQSLVMTD